MLVNKGTMSANKGFICVTVDVPLWNFTNLVYKILNNSNLYQKCPANPILFFFYMSPTYDVLDGQMTKLVERDGPQGGCVGLVAVVADV